MPSPTDRNLTALPTKTVKPTRRRQTRHFTQLDQVTQLVAARDADPDLGFMARLLALCSLPRTNPKNRYEFNRVNGPYTLYMVAGGGNKLPYGTLPRLLLAWVCTEAVRTQSPELILGDSLSEFMRKVGIYRVAGPALLDGQGRVDSFAITAAHRAVATAPRGIVSAPRVSLRGCPVPRMDGQS